ncbi:MAG TPA: hypothetical protein VIX83_13370 [Candidatus Cybelea sp.]
MEIHTVNRVPTNADYIDAGLDIYRAVTIVEVSQKAFQNQIDGNYWPADFNDTAFS